MAIITMEPWDHCLFDEGDGWLLTVLCGAAALYEVTVRLTEKEITAAKTDPDFVRRLARQITRDPESFKPRQIVPSRWPAKEPNP